MRVRMLLPLIALFTTVDSAFARDPIVRPEGEGTVTKHRPGTPGGRPLTADEPPAEEAAPEAEPVDEDGPDPDAPAAEPVEEGLGTWVRRMEGEPAPSTGVLHEIEERAEEQAEDLRLIDEKLPAVGFASPTPPTGFYADPKKTLANDPLHLADIDPAEFDIPIVVNDDVIRWMEYFTGPGRKYYERWMSRSTRYRPMMLREIDERHMPHDLVYLSMIESGYSPHAYSSADAAGLWQFIAATGRMYDLRIDYYVDERRDPEWATEAGVSHLSDLYKMWGDWPLAWASYNAGPGRVKRATEKAGSKDFWDLEAGPYLHTETDNYVPKIMAAAIIGHHPDWYGFTNIQYQDALVYDIAKVPGSVDIGVLAKCAGISLQEFSDLNPALRRTSTPPEGYEARVPVGAKETFLAKLDAVPAEQRVAAATHTVRRGETLGIIASNYGTSVTDIVTANHLTNKNIIEVGQTLVIPKAGTGGEVAAARRAEPNPTTGPTSWTPSSRTLTTADAAPRSESARVQAPAPKPVAPRYYTVRSGDTLTEIATRYDTSVSQLRTWNSLKSDKILVGARLKVGAGSAATASTSTVAKASTTPAAPASTKIVYTVKRGDALGPIAEAHGVGLSSIQKWNHITNPSSITVGQQLTIYVPAAAWTKYTVRSGDSLGEIATKYGCSIAQLRDWNELDTTVIQPGQVLKVKKA